MLGQEDCNNKRITPKLHIVTEKMTPQIDTTNNFIIIHYGKIIISKPTAAFDLDYTLIKTKSRRLFAKDKDDWEFLYDNIKDDLIRLSKQFNIIIFTNQKGLNHKNTENVKRKDFLYKINSIATELNIPLHIYVSLKHGYYRKPLTGLWELYHHIISPLNFYCGDAAGREDDFAITDWMFANNINIQFYTPEQLFLNKSETIEYTWPTYLTDYIGKPEEIILPQKDKLLILMCGYPGSGKSSLAKSFQLPIISNDILGTRAKCIRVATKYLKEGKSIIIDNVNHTIESRKEYYTLGKLYDFHVVIIYINNHIEFCYYMNQLRCQLFKEAMIPKIAYYTMAKKFTIPDKSECDVLIEIPNKVSEYQYLFPKLYI